MRGDLVDTTAYTDKNLRELAQFSLSETNKYDSAYVYYRVINNCNYYIAHRDTTLRTGATYVAMNEYVAVKAIRAWAYMQLARVFGKVPFYTEPLTQISQIDNNQYPELDMDGIVARLAPDLEQYTGYGLPVYGNAPSGITTSQLFIPVDVVMGDMYLETGQYAQAARHYITYLTEVLGSNRSHSAYMQNVTFNGRRSSAMMEMLPSDWGGTFNYSVTQWENIFTGGSDVITYIPMAPNNRAGVTTLIPLAYGYDFYSNTTGYIDEIQIVPSVVYNTLTESQDYYYKSSLSTVTRTILNSVKIGDTRNSAITRERDDNESSETTTWITKNRYAQVYLYRVSTVWLRLAEAFNRMGMPDAAFAILKDGVSENMLATYADGTYYMDYLTDESRMALQTIYPLLSEVNLPKFTADNACGIHCHGAGKAASDYPGVNGTGGKVYHTGKSPYQLSRMAGLKMAEIAKKYEIAVGTSKQDTINAIEDLICDEYALESAFEGNRYYDLLRIANHKNRAGIYGGNFGDLWLQKRLGDRGWTPAKKYLPFK